MNLLPISISSSCKSLATPTTPQQHQQQQQQQLEQHQPEQQSTLSLQGQAATPNGLNADAAAQKSLDSFRSASFQSEELLLNMTTGQLLAETELTDEYR
ncbi:hypothetical protein ACLKA7_001630 [Drosophila subpalustris]